MSSSADKIEQLKALTSKGRSADAYALASEWVSDLSGEPLFDFYYGMAAVDANHADEGVMALERVLLVHPENDRVRLEYARGMFIIEDNETAKREFTTVLDKKPPESVAKKIRHYLELIEKREQLYNPTLLFFAQAGGGYDSNLNSAPEDQLSRVQLTGESLGKGDSFYEMKAGLAYTRPYDKDNSFFVTADVLNKVYDDEDTFNSQYLNLLGGWRYKVDASNRIQVFLRAQNYRVDDATSRNLYGATVDWSHNFSSTLVVNGSLTYSRLKYPDNSISWRDADQYSGALTLYKTLPVWHNPILSISSFYGDETPDVKSIVSNASVDKKFYGGSIALQIPVNEANLLTLSATYQEAKYSGADWLYGIKREDQYQSLNLNWNYAISKALSVAASASLISNDSTIELYEYDREIVALSLKYEY